MADTVSLFLVPTPIGNRGDVSPRVLETLNAVDFIAAEDTRTSGLMLSGFGVHKPMVSYFDHNRKTHGELILNRLLAGETCALITDAGMPGISDPGQELAALCHENGLKVSALPGPCAFVTALAMSGMDSKHFYFEGFLPIETKERRLALERVRSLPCTVLFYEAPHRLIRTLSDFAETFGEDRRLCWVREISKIYEECRPTTVGRALSYFNETPPRGEFVLIVEGSGETEEKLPESEIPRLWEELKAEGFPKSAAAKKIAALTGKDRKEVYAILTAL